MTNAQLFSYPNINLKFNENLVAPDLLTNIQIGEVIWESILGKDNRELMASSLLNSQKIITFVEKTRQDFISNFTNTRKYPKLSQVDWE